MLDNLFQQLSLTIKNTKYRGIKSWKSSILILSLGGLIAPAEGIASESVYPLGSQVLAQTNPTATTKEKQLIEVGVLLKEDLDQTIAK